MKRTLLKLIPVIAGVFIMGSSYGQCPTITCPTNITVSNDSGACGAVVNYTTPVGIDMCASGTQTFSYTGSIQTWTVPAGVTMISVDAYGAKGGNSADGGTGGNGGRVQADLPVTPGTTLNIYVGGAGTMELSVPTGGYNGGGGTDVHNTSQHAGTGGGASDVRVGGTTLNDRVIVAGGGGGGGYTGSAADGGAGGGLVGATGNTWNGYPAGTGGTQTAGGIGGSGAAWNQPSAFPGVFGSGGQGEGWSGGGGGGGGGWYGGGGAFISGGGGGSSYTDPSATNVTHTQGVQTGHGQVIISYAGAAVSTTQSSGLSSGSTFPIGTTVCEYIATNNFGSDTCSFTVTVVDTTKPTVTCPGDVTTCDNIVTNIAPSTTDNCTGETVAYTITGATTGSGTNDASGTSFNEGLSTVTYIVTDASGNQDSCSFTVEVQTSSSTISPVSCGSYTAPSGAVYTMSNTYMDTIPNSNMCDSVITINLTVVDVDVSTSLAGDTITSNDNDNGVTYQWLNCDSGYAVIAGATNQSYIAAINGNYAVEVTENGCVDTSACVTIVHQGLGELFNKGINIYPNPTNDVVNIDMGRYQGVINYELVSVEGKVIQSVKGVSNKKIQIDLGKESKGIYLLKLYNAEGVGVHRIIKE